jgi:hypothetical protein
MMARNLAQRAVSRRCTFVSGSIDSEKRDEDSVVSIPISIDCALQSYSLLQGIVRLHAHHQPFWSVSYCFFAAMEKEYLPEPVLTET